MLTIVDPLKLRLQQYFSLDNGNFDIKSVVNGYGNERDIQDLIDECSNVGDTNSFFLVDLTPFDHISTHLESLITRQLTFNDKQPVLMIKSVDILGQIRRLALQNPQILVSFEPDGQYRGIVDHHDHSQIDSPLGKRVKGHLQSLLSKTSLVNVNLRDIRQAYAQGCLDRCLSTSRAIHTPANNGMFPTHTKSEQNYIVNPNNMLVSHYLILKSFGIFGSILVTIIYETLLILNDYFIEPSRYQYDVLVTSNNTGLFLISSIIPFLPGTCEVVPIDRLGPIPAANLRSDQLRKKLQGKRVVLIEDVIATGSEITLTSFFLTRIGAKLEMIIAFYDLEIGKSELTSQVLTHSLCKPKYNVLMDYELRSK